MKKSHSNETDAASPQATYQDVLDAPPHMVAEIVSGKLYTHPRPAFLHAIANSGLGARIATRFHFGDGGPGGWWILNEPELHLGEDILVPDIAGWRRERIPVLPTGAYCTLAPDWVCEVLSPSTRKFDLGSKRGIYAREGVGYLWLVDPNVQSLEAFELHGTEWVLIGQLFDDASVSLPPFEAVSFNLADLWQPHVVHQELPSKPTAETEPELIETSK